MESEAARVISVLGERGIIRRSSVHMPFRSSQVFRFVSCLSNPTRLPPPAVIEEASADGLFDGPVFHITRDGNVHRPVVG